MLLLVGACGNIYYGSGPFKQGDYVTVELADSKDIGLISKPLIATALPSLSDWK
jgi:hypothetical protein